MSQFQSERGITMLPCHPLLLLASTHLQATFHILKNSLWKSSICYCCLSVWMCLWHLTHILRLIAQLCFLINRKRLPILRFQALGLIQDHWQFHKNSHQVTAQRTHLINLVRGPWHRTWWTNRSIQKICEMPAHKQFCLKYRSCFSKMSSLKLENPLASRKGSVLPSARLCSLLQHCSPLDE